MNIQSALSTSADPREAANELCDSIADGQPDFAAVWVSAHHGPEYDEVVEAVRERLNPRNLIGCSCQSVIGPDREVENQPGAALWTAQMPNVRILPFILDENDLQSLETMADLHDRLGVTPDQEPTFIVLPDPFSFQFDGCLKVMDEAFPGSTIVGGLASAGRAPGENRLFLNDQILRQGMVGVSLSGGVGVSSVVSQGCRPIGERYVITKSESNVILELGGQSAYSVLQEVHSAADEADKELMRNGVHVGRVMDELADNFEVGDFLIRNVAGVVENKGLAITDYFRTGQTVQFHIRDAKSADAEMRALLARKLELMPSKPLGGMLFNCNGRGVGMFDERDHDISVINSAVENCPIGGFFAAGEIGPVGGKTFVHGLTSSLILFHEP